MGCDAIRAGQHSIVASGSQIDRVGSSTKPHGGTSRKPMLNLTGIYLSEACEITGTEDPRQTLALSHKPDAILMDLRMPDYSGLNYAKASARTNLGATGYLEKSCGGTAESDPVARQP